MNSFLVTIFLSRKLEEIHSSKIAVLKISGQKYFVPSKLFTILCRDERLPVITNCFFSSTRGIKFLKVKFGIGNVSPLNHSYRNHIFLLYCPHGSNCINSIHSCCFNLLKRYLKKRRLIPFCFNANTNCL